ncbi:hypothetical protein ES705_11913 [subsurface metagenome]
MEKGRWIPDYSGMTYREVGMKEGLKITIFTYKWGKCVKPVEKYILENLIL